MFCVTENRAPISALSSCFPLLACWCCHPQNIRMGWAILVIFDPAQIMTDNIEMVQRHLASSISAPIVDKDRRAHHL